MRISELFESNNSHVSFCFGRMNPPTVGHKLLLDTLESIGGDYKIFLSQTQDKKKNPLDYSTKIGFMKSMFPEHAKNIVDDSSLNTVLKVASHLHDLGYRNATFVAGSDRIEEMSNLLKDYNNVEGKSHGFYNFEVLDFKSSGEREDGAEGVSGVSASNARSAAANNDFEKFKESTGAGQHAEKLFSAVKRGLGVKESITKEFASDGGEEDSLLKYARMWYNGNSSTKEQVEQILDRIGWEIGELESEEGGAFVVRSEDENSDSYIGFTLDDLTEGLAEGYGRYWCSTDKKWKTRKGPKQTRKSK